jgi:hypothetical protein
MESGMKIPLLLFIVLNSIFLIPYSVHASVIPHPTNNLGLVGYWPFDEGSGTTANDYSGNGNTGTLTNGPTWVTGQLNRALNFNGTNQYVSLSTGTGIPISNSSYTLSVWFKATSLGSRDGLVGWGNYGVGNNLVNALRLTDSGECSGGQGVINYWWGNDLTLCSTRVTANAWHHVVAEYNGTTRIIYVDGVSIGSDTPVGHNVPNTSNFKIGVTNGADPFPGSIDDVRIYNRALSANDVKLLYQQGLAQVTKAKLGTNPIVIPAQNFLNGLVGYWPMEEGSGATTADISSNKNTGTLVSSPTWTKGRYGSALSFSGAQTVTTTYRATLGDFTACLWFDAIGSDGGSNNRLVDKNFGGGFWMGRSSSVANSWGGGVEESGSPFGIFVTLKDGVWHQLCSMRSGTTHTIIGDGGAVSTSNTVSAAPLSADFFSIGGNAFKGIIDDVRIYNRALSASEIKQLYLNESVHLAANNYKSGPGDIAPGAAVWYGLRAYNVAYVLRGSKKAITIRRASDSATKDITVLYTGALDVATAKSFCSGTSCFVTKMYDQSGNGNDVSQATPSKQPQFVFNGGPNGATPALLFTSTSAQVLVAGSNITHAVPATFSAVYKPTSGTNKYILSSAGVNAQNTYEIGVNLCSFFISAGSTPATIAWSGCVYHAVQNVLSNAGNVYIDGVSTGSTVQTNGLANAFAIGGDANGSAFFDGYFVEGGVWLSALSGTQEAAMNTNQHTYWGF